MTQEQKAKAYDEALERAKSFIEYGDFGERTVAESIFAGLVEESEDEKIRKEIIDLVEYTREHRIGYDFHVSRDEMIAWLEKQVEQKSSIQLDYEIPFGAKDSELIEESYYIPKGYHAEISKNRITIKKQNSADNDLKKL